MKTSGVVLRRRLRFSILVVVSQVLLIALAIFYGVHLIMIAQNGGVFAIEQNAWVLYGEIVATVVICFFAVFVVVMEIRRMGLRRQGEVDQRQPRPPPGPSPPGPSPPGGAGSSGLPP